MTFTRMAFPSTPWTPSPTHPLERKKTPGTRPAALLEFAPGFADPNACDRSHVLYVLRGELELELAASTERLAAGEACWLDRGTVHRARNPGSEPALVFVISDIEHA